MIFPMSFQLKIGDKLYLLKRQLSTSIFKCWQIVFSKVLLILNLISCISHTDKSLICCSKLTKLLNKRDAISIKYITNIFLFWLGELMFLPKKPYVKNSLIVKNINNFKCLRYIKCKLGIPNLQLSYAS